MTPTAKGFAADGGRRRNCQLSRAGALIVAALLEENKTPAATLFRRTAEPPLSRGARGVQGLSQVGEQVVDHSLKV